jgi:hypothetical protein
LCANFPLCTLLIFDHPAAHPAHVLPYILRERDKMLVERVPLGLGIDMPTVGLNLVAYDHHLGFGVSVKEGQGV